MYFYGSERFDIEITVVWGLIFYWNLRKSLLLSIFPSPVLGIPIPLSLNAVLLTNSIIFERSYVDWNPSSNIFFYLNPRSNNKLIIISKSSSKNEHFAYEFKTS